MTSDFLTAWDATAKLAPGAMSDTVLQASRRTWFDTLAALGAGVRENTTRAAFASCEKPDAAALSAADAALVLGTASHALDYDDVCMLATCHPSAPVVAALLAALPMAGRPGPTLRELFSAYALGTETTLRLGEWLGFRHYSLGFHATGTLGSIGSAAALSQLLRLSREQAHNALAIAASSACGLRANFGTDTKPLHVGFAAAAGVRAVLLARAGALASDDVWGEAGFFRAFTGGEPMRALPWQAGMPFALEQPGFEFKRYPSCYMTHRLITGVLAIRAKHPEAVAQPVDIEVELCRDGMAPLKHPRPTNGLEAKFSGPYCAAAAWIDGRADLGAFAIEAVQRPAIAAQMARVTMRERTLDGEGLDTAPISVTVRGATFEEHINVDWAPGSPADPMTREQMLAKWRDCARHAGLPEDATLALGLLDAPLDTPAASVLPALRQAFLQAAAS